MNSAAGLENNSVPNIDNTRLEREQKLMIELFRDRFRDIHLPSHLTCYMPHHLSKEWVRKIQSHERAGRNEDAAESFVDGLLDCWDKGSFAALIDALKETEYETIRKLLLNEDVYCYDCFQGLLRLNFDEACDTIQLDANCGLLLDLKNECLNRTQYEKVKRTLENDGNTSAMDVLLAFVARTKSDWPVSFLRILEKHGCNSLYDKLAGFMRKDGNTDLDIANSDTLQQWHKEQAEAASVLQRGTSLDDSELGSIREDFVCFSESGERDATSVPSASNVVTGAQNKNDRNTNNMNNDQELAANHSVSSNEETQRKCRAPDGAYNRLNVQQTMAAKSGNKDIERVQGERLDETCERRSDDPQVNNENERERGVTQPQPNGLGSGSLTLNLSQLQLSDDDAGDDDSSTDYGSDDDDDEAIPSFSNAVGGQFNEGNESKPTQKKLQLRSHQMALAEKGNSGENTIIVAPTNYGKTFVALDICKKHLERNEQNKLIFFVPSVSLILQQHKRFEEYLGEFKSLGISGETRDHGPFHLLVQNYRILVMTAQVLLNAMMESENETRVSIDMFSMFVFDECHHTDKGHPYNEIMCLYMTEKLEKKSKYLPQIIGLTASPGANKSNTLEKAVEHIMRMCANLDSLMVCPPLDPNNTSDLNKIKSELRRIEPRAEDIFQRCVLEVMTAIEGKMKKIKGIDDDMDREIPGFCKRLHSCPAGKEECQYTQWVSEMEKIFPTIYEQKVRKQLNACIKYLKYYHQSLLLNLESRSRDALGFLAATIPTINVQGRPCKLDKFLQQSYGRVYEALSTRVDDERYTNPLMTKLKDLLTWSYHKYQSECRVIVFVKTRELARILEDWMNEDEQLKQLNAKFLVGQEMTKSKQEDVLKYFSDGDHKVLVATTVAEEGLDVKQCSLVIRYNHVTNEIAMVQTRGRARKEGSRYVVIALAEKVTRKEEVNEMREQIMRKAIQEITRKYREDNARFKLDLRNLQIEELRLRKLSIEKKSKKDTGLYRVYCSYCDMYVCDSSDFRKVCSGFTILTDEIDARYRHRKGEAQRYDEIDERGKIACVKCNSHWGTLNIYRERVYPFFKISVFVLENSESGKRCRLIKKWKDSPFDVNPISDEDKEKMIKRSNISAEDLRRVNP
ncbi:ATP-dependent RNA helicase DHX58-like isoform X2 [Tubulanus polymorphus]|uniref:ATP-dependent RNA helicase DHX58-like isoform X2 n=1 Tax=Tubulanus polymorphus TaxID=672921 RepID=UPI003DA28078